MRHSFDNVILASPSELPQNDIDQAHELIRQGGAVFLPGLKERIRSAHSIAFIRSRKLMVAVAAIKNPGLQHVHDFSIRSGYAIGAGMRELGYVTVQNQFRGWGLATLICARILSTYAEPLFASTSNPAMIALFERQGWKKVGTPWPSGLDHNLQLTLWVWNLKSA